MKNSITNKKIYAMILVISVILRTAIAVYYGDNIQNPPLLLDQLSYHHLGKSIIEGNGFSFDRPWYPFGSPAGSQTAFWSFLYSIFVAAVYAVFGVHPLAVRLVQGILGGIFLPWAVYRWAEALFSNDVSGNVDAKQKSEIIGLIAAGCAAIYGYFILYAVTVMTETFYMITLLWSLTIALRLGRVLQTGKSGSLFLSLQLGISLGLCALLRQSILPWVPVLFIWLLLNARPRYRMTFQMLKPLFIAGFIMIAFIIPFTLRNYRVYGEFLLLNSNTGYAMYSAQHPMHGTRFQEFEAAPLPSDLERVNEAHMDRELMARGLQFIMDDPWRYVLLSLSRVRAYIEFWPTPDTTLLHNIGRSGSYGLFLPFMIYGLVLCIKHQVLDAGPGLMQGTAHFTKVVFYLSRPVSLLLLFTLFYSVLHILTWAMVRYRLPVDAVMLPCAALAIQTLATKVVHKLHYHK